MEHLEIDFLIIGGVLDFNIQHLIKHCEAKKIRAKHILLGRDLFPSVTTDFQNKTLIVDDKWSVRPKSVFIRPNVFEFIEKYDANEHRRAYDWFTLFNGYLLANQNIKMFNRAYFQRNASNKVENLFLAEEVGLKIPKTYATSSVTMMQNLIKEGEYVYKSIDTAGFTGLLQTETIEKLAQGATPLPYFIQEKLVFPELRLFYVDGEVLAFGVNSDSLDCRVPGAKTELTYTSVPAHLEPPFIELCKRMRLDYAAADFKTHPITGELLFLEINTGPMFTSFDIAAKGAVCDAFLKFFIG